MLSDAKMYSESRTHTTMTTPVDPISSSRVGQDTFFISVWTLEKNSVILAILFTFTFAGETGLEPATYGFGDRRSTN